jgi:parallel beta-helix repeat protein
VRIERIRGALLSTLVIVSIIALAIPLLSSSPVHAALSSHAPIFIYDNSGFTKPDPVNGGGSGTGDDPYIIENWVINASSTTGILIMNTTAYFVIRNCLVENGGVTYYGIFLDNVINGKIENNTIKNNSTGIFLASSDNTIIENNLVDNSSNNGIWLYYSDNNHIENNLVDNSSNNGIYLYYSDNTIIENNTAENNLGYGIVLDYLSNNLVIYNTVRNNGYGIFLYSSENNLIYYNNIINNPTQAYDDGANYWDDGYPSGGNYWSDYTGVDNYWGKNQDIPGSDGMGDTPYNISGGANQDRYPLMSPWAVGPRAEIRTVVYSVADVYAFSGDGARYSRSQLKFDIGNIPSGSNILSAKLWLYRFAADNWDGEILLNRVDNQLWGENITAGDFDSQAITNEETRAGKFMSPGWDYLDVENQLNVDYEAGHAYSSYRLRWANDDGSEPSVGIDDGRFLVIESEHDDLCIFFHSSEYNGSEPYLEVVYVIQYAVSVSISPTYKSGAPGEELSYTVMVANMGNLDDNYVLTVSDNMSWGPTLGDNLLEVPAGESRQTTLSVTIPAGAENCTRDNITVTAISQADNTVRDNASCIAHAVWVGRIPRGPIYINGDDNFIPANGVTSGSGAENDPYIIENWVINAENANGIWIEGTTAHFVIRNCYVHDGWNNWNRGIYFINASNGKIYSNTLENNYIGINLDFGSENNTLDNNTCENDGGGIYLYDSENIKMRNNTLSNNLYNFGIEGTTLSHFVHDIDNSNLVNGKPIRYLVDNKNEIIGPSLEMGYLGLVNCDNIRVENLALGNNEQGILLAGTKNSWVENCTLENNFYGIHLFGSFNDTLTNSTCKNNGSGIHLEYSDSNLLSNNTVENGYNPSIELEYSDNNLLSNNTVENNRNDGIRLHYSDNALVVNNTVKNNFYDGIDISGSNNIVSNNIVENNGNGIRLDGSNNFLYNNICSNSNEYGIRVDSSNNTLDNNTCCSNNYYGIFLESSSNNTLSNNIVENNFSGIQFEYSDNNIISNNIIRKNLANGIRLDYSHNNLIENNIAENNGDDGIELGESENNLILNNIAKNNLYNGVVIWNSDYNIIENNLLENNYYGIDFAYGSDNNLVSNNTVENNGYGIYLLVQGHGSNNNRILNNIVENNSVVGIYLEGSENNLIENNLVENNQPGIQLYSSHNNLISNNIVENNSGGIYLSESDNNALDNNTVENNFYEGIVLSDSNNNLIENNLVENDGYGILLGYSGKNLISNNLVKNNYSYGGIWLGDRVNNNIIRNNLLENNGTGIYIGYSENNLIENNTTENNGHGIFLESSNNNRIYHNNLVGNATQAYDIGSNYWDNGYPSGGNYWSDYTGVDENHGENQDIPGSDVIGDTPYYISGGSNRDRYPLMNPWPFNMIVRAVQVVITPPSQENNNGGTLKYDVLVKNLGNVQENFKLENGDNAGWTLSLDNNWLLVPKGGTGTTKLTVNIPTNATGGTWDNISVKATSKDNASVFDNKSCLAHVTIVRGIQVVITPPSQENDNGGTLTYTVTVNNTGNVPENFQLMRGDNASWTLSLDNNWLLVPKGETGTTKLTVNIPTNATGGTWDNISVKATSKDNASVFDNESCLAHVKVVGVAPVAPPDTTPPPAPSLISPANGANLNDNTPTLDWSAVSDNSPPVLYYVAVSDNSEFHYENRNSGWITADRWDVTPALHNGVWYWRVRAKDSAGNVGNNSVTRWFRVDTLKPPAPTLISPANAATIADNTPVFDWSDVSDPSGVTYDLSIARDAGFASIAIQKTGQTASTYEPTLAEALAAGAYYWRVRAVDNAGNAGSWSEDWSFTVTAAPAPAAFTVSSLTISPSQVSAGQEVSISITVKNTGDLAGTYTVTLQVNGIVESTENVTLAGGATKLVVFTVTRNAEGTYSIGVGVLTGTFVVTTPSIGLALPIAIVVVVAIIVGGAAIFIKRQKLRRILQID